MAELDLDEDKEFLLDGIINEFELIPAASALSPAEMDNYRSSTKPEARDKVIIIIIIHLFQIPLYTICNNNNYIKIKKLNDQKSTLY